MDSKNRYISTEQNQNETEQILDLKNIILSYALVFSSDLILDNS